MFTIYSHAHIVQYIEHWESWRACVCLCATLSKKFLDHTSNSAQDTNWALRWPSVAGSLMTSTSLAQTVRWFPLRTGLFDLSAELVDCMGQGERPAGQTCDELRLIATDSMFCLFRFFWSFHRTGFFLFSPLYFAGSSSEVVWKQRFLTSNHKLGRCRFK